MRSGQSVDMDIAQFRGELHAWLDEHADEVALQYSEPGTLKDRLDQIPADLKSAPNLEKLLANPDFISKYAGDDQPRLRRGDGLLFLRARTPHAFDHAQGPL